MRELVELVPRELLREKVLDASLRHELRYLSRVAKRVRQPEGRAVAAKLLTEEALTHEELSHERFARWNVAILFGARAKRSSQRVPASERAISLESPCQWTQRTISTHVPPIGMKRPSLARSLMRANSSGWSSFSQANCCACEHVNLYSGYSSISRN